MNWKRVLPIVALCLALNACGNDEIVLVGSVVSIQGVGGIVELKRAGSKIWATVTQTNGILFAGDQLRTRGDSFANLVFTNHGKLHISSFSEIEIQQVQDREKSGGANLIVRLLAKPVRATRPAGVMMAPPYRPHMVAMFSPDGKSILTTHADRGVRIWNVETGQKILTLIGHGDYIDAARFSPDGKSLLTRSRGDHIWNVEKGERLWSAESAEIRFGRQDVEFSPDSKDVLMDLISFDVATGKSHGSLLRGNRLPPDGNLRSIIYSPDGHNIFLVLSGRAFSPTASAGHVILMLEVETGQIVRRFEGHTDLIRSVDVSHDGKLLLTGGSDKSLRLWEIATGKDLNRFPNHDDFVQSVAFSPSGKYALADCSQGIALWEANSGRKIGQFKGRPFFRRVFSPDEKHFITAYYDDVVRMWANDSGEQVQAFRGNGVNSPYSEYIREICFSPDGKYVLSVGGDDTARLWDPKTGKVVRKWVFALTF